MAGRLGCPQSPHDTLHIQHGRLAGRSPSHMPHQGGCLPECLLVRSREKDNLCLTSTDPWTDGNLDRMTEHSTIIPRKRQNFVCPGVKGLLPELLLTRAAGKRSPVCIRSSSQLESGISLLNTYSGAPASTKPMAVVSAKPIAGLLRSCQSPHDKLTVVVHLPIKCVSECSEPIISTAEAFENKFPDCTFSK